MNTRNMPGKKRRKPALVHRLIFIEGDREKVEAAILTYERRDMPHGASAEGHMK